MPANIGILAAEVYFPKTFISQTVLEKSDGVPGKYTKGLGQFSMAVCDDAEDVNSLALTVTQRLIERTNLDLKKVGFLEVGSESLVDKSKSTKSVLMSLFEESGNFDLAGIDVKSACYGGTAALFNAINWLESSCCDGRLAVVVAADIAVYATPSTQPTGGAGAVALLLGPEAPLVIDPGLRVCAMRHHYDFYKPVMRSVFPEVDGQLSIACYKEALLTCYNLYRSKVEKATGLHASIVGDASHSGFPIYFACFHSPFCRLVAKSFGWLALQDTKVALSRSRACLNNNNNAPTNNNACETINGSAPAEVAIVQQLAPVVHEADSTQVSREVDALCVAATRDLFASKVEPGLRISSQVGNMYTASLYSCLISLACSVPEAELRGRRVLMFSYGSGYTASMFSLRISEKADFGSVFGLPCNSPLDRLALRTPIDHAQFLQRIQSREASVDKAPVEFPSEDLEERFFPGTYYLARIDEKHRRFYQRTPTH
uniref:Hydroxymethylglutaryl-CoA synthase n=1 Tax=Mesocestoides corti TaxID=53468 RepID=A0A5K3FA22_MESCO